MRISYSSRGSRISRTSRSSDAGQTATTAAIEGSRAAAWMACQPPMLEPRIATAGACSRMRSHMESTSPNAVGPNSPVERPWPRAS